MARLVVVGGGYAGQMAMARARALSPALEIVLVEPRDAFEERIRLHEMVAHGTSPVHPLEPICRQLDVRHVRSRAERIDDGRVWIDGEPLAFDAAIVALGSRGRALAGAEVIDSASDATTWREREQGEDVSVFGGGLTAIEMASELAVAHPARRVEIVRRSPWKGLSKAAGRLVDARLDFLGVGVNPTRTLSGRAIGCVGFEPVPLAGLTTTGRVAVDDFLRASDTVFVAGDMARTPNDVGMGCVSAMPLGTHAAENALAGLAGRSLRPFRFKRVLSATSLGGHDAVVDGPWVFGGRLGSLTKRMILAYTVAVWKMERATRWRPYRWPIPSSFAEPRS